MSDWNCFSVQSIYFSSMHLYTLKVILFPFWKEIHLSLNKFGIFHKKVKAEYCPKDSILPNLRSRWKNNQQGRNMSENFAKVDQEDISKFPVNLY